MLPSRPTDWPQDVLTNRSRWSLVKQVMPDGRFPYWYKCRGACGECVDLREFVIHISPDPSLGAVRQMLDDRCKCPPRARPWQDPREPVRMWG